MALVFSDSATEITKLAAAVDGITLRAGGRIGHDGKLDGAASARLRGSYLRKSPLLSVPAAIGGGITVPVYIRGTLAQPELNADVAAALREKLGTERMASSMNSAFDGFRNVVDGVADGAANAFGEAANALDDLLGTRGGDRRRDTPVAPQSARPPDEDHELEALVDRCMRGGPDTDELIDRLLDAGVTTDDIARILEKRRRW